MDPAAPADLTCLGMVVSDRTIDDQAFTCRKTVVNEYKECLGTLFSLLCQIRVHLWVLR